MDVQNNKQPLRVEALDSLRGWAILAVIAIHVAQSAPLPAGFLHTLAINGDMGVELFYVLSAYSLMMMLHARAKAGRSSVRGYFIRRLFRIAPMFWVALLLSILFFLGKPSFWSPEGFGWIEVASTAVFLHGVHPAFINAVVPGGWSVAVEVMFYLLLPMLCKYIKTPVSALISLALSLMLFYAFGIFSQSYFDQILPENARYLSEIYSWYMSFPAQLPVFLMGLTSFLFVRDRSIKSIYAYTIACVGIAALLVIPLPADDHSMPRHILWGAIFAMLIVANVQQPLSLLDNPLLRRIGRISFSIYLLHFFVLLVIGKVFRHSVLQAEIKYLLLYCCIVGITYFLASWSYRKIELPGIGVGRELSRKFEAVPLGSGSNSGVGK